MLYFYPSWLPRRHAIALCCGYFSCVTCVYRTPLQNKEILQQWQILTSWNIRESSVNDTIIKEVSFNETIIQAGTGLACNTSQSYVKYESFPRLLFGSSRNVRTDSREEIECMQILCRYFLLECDWNRGGGAPFQANLNTRDRLSAWDQSLCFFMHRHVVKDSSRYSVLELVSHSVFWNVSGHTFCVFMITCFIVFPTILFLLGHCYIINRIFETYMFKCVNLEVDDIEGWFGMVLSIINCCEI